MVDLASRCFKDRRISWTRWPGAKGEAEKKLQKDLEDQQKKSLAITLLEAEREKATLTKQLQKCLKEKEEVQKGFEAAQKDMVSERQKASRLEEMLQECLQEKEHVKKDWEIEHQETLSLATQLQTCTQEKEELQNGFEAAQKYMDTVQKDVDSERQKATTLEAMLQECLQEKEQVTKDLETEHQKALSLATQLQTCAQEKEELQKGLQAEWQESQRLAKHLQTCLDDNEQLSTLVLAQLPAAVPAAPNSSVERLRMSETGPEYRALKNLFEASMVRHCKSFDSREWCEKPDVVVTHIQHVINPFTQPRYEAARAEVLGRNPKGCKPVRGIAAAKCRSSLRDEGPDLNEYFLFHGTRFHFVDYILQHGLDPQRGGDAAGAMFGRGTYFAENASKSDMYTTCQDCALAGSFKDCRHPTGRRCMMVAQVLLGESLPVKAPDQTRLRAADRADGRPYDSHTALKRAYGGCVDHAEYIIFKEQLALVRFLIFYRHKESCQCKDCLQRRQPPT